MEVVVLGSSSWRILSFRTSGSSVVGGRTSGFTDTHAGGRHNSDIRTENLSHFRCRGTRSSWKKNSSVHGRRDSRHRGTWRRGSVFTVLHDGNGGRLHDGKLASENIGKRPGNSHRDGIGKLGNGGNGNMSGIGSSRRERKRNRARSTIGNGQRTHGDSSTRTAPNGRQQNARRRAHGGRDGHRRQTTTAGCTRTGREAEMGRTAASRTGAESDGERR